MATTTARRVRTPGIVYSAVGVALLIVLAAIALTTRQPPPPTIAEFAPQAVEQIRNAPSEQSSNFGSAPGEGGAGSPRKLRQARSVEQSVIDVARVRRCVGNPPRQIEDPQSPPCVPYWSGDNGGSTWQGVTRDEIRVFVPTGNPSEAATGDVFAPLEKFFNSRFEFYGRKLKFIYGGAYPNAGTRDVASQMAAATDADTRYKVFASLRFRTAQGFYYHEELARRHIPSFTGAEWGYESSYLQSKQPSIWQYVVETDEMLGEMGLWTCARLAGHTARFAGAGSQGKPRAFGVLVQTYYNGEKTTAAPLASQLRRCGVTPKISLRNPMQAATGSEDDQIQPDPVAAQNVVLQLQQAGVTSVLCICQPYAAGSLEQAATKQSYFPEWIFSSYGAQDTIWGAKLGQAPPEQLAHVFGMSFTPRQVLPSREPAAWAVKEADPAFSYPSAYGSVTVFNFTYRNILELASAIQMAGPKLTPATLASGLHATTFPNPDHPNRPGRVGFVADHFAMMRDANEWWWSNLDSNPYGGTGTICYVDHGARRVGGGWAKGDAALFRPPCDSGAR